ncbi:MAG: Rrf2 family transcriptional regulator [Planctomycetes bacterium]|nr:Rrf2 family transcriptional regulator [Planctomycetota bacterium]
MLQLTKRTEYGMLALVHMLDRDGEYVSVREICERYPLPKRTVAEVLKDLARNGVVESQRGAGGGYTLARSPDEITLGHVVSALEGAPALTSCESALVLKNGGCEVQPSCPIRSPIHRVRERLWQMLEHTTLRSLVASGGHVPLHTAAASAPHAP